MRHARGFALALALVAALAACNGGGHDDGKTSVEPFVTNAIAHDTSDTSEPFDVNGQDFQFSEAEGQFQELLH